MTLNAEKGTNNDYSYVQLLPRKLYFSKTVVFLQFNLKKVNLTYKQKICKIDFFFKFLLLSFFFFLDFADRSCRLKKSKLKTSLLQYCIKLVYNKELLQIYQFASNGSMKVFGFISYFKLPK